MSLSTILKTLGHDGTTLLGWIDAAAPVAGSVLAIVDPPLAPVITGVEAGIAALASVGKTPTSADLQAITAAATTNAALLHVAAPAASPAPAPSAPTSAPASTSSADAVMSNLAKSIATELAALLTPAPAKAAAAAVAVAVAEPAAAVPKAA